MKKRMLDALDIELLRLLMEDSRQTYLNLSKKLHVHKDTVRKRVRNLRQQKVIERFTILINQQKMSELYPSLWRVFFTISALREHNSLVQELLNHPNVIEVDEATPSAVHDILVQTQFKQIEEFHAFTHWLKSKHTIDPSQLNVIPIYKQHRRRVRTLSVLTPEKEN